MGGSGGNYHEFYNSLRMYHNAWAQYFYQIQGMEYPGWSNPYHQFQGKERNFKKYKFFRESNNTILRSLMLMKVSIYKIVIPGRFEPTFDFNF